MVAIKVGAIPKRRGSAQASTRFLVRGTRTRSNEYEGS